MIYLVSSVALSRLISEPRRPSSTFWQQPFGSSRLLQFEVWNRLNARRADGFRNQNLDITLASYDHRPLAAATALAFPSLQP